MTAAVPSQQENDINKYLGDFCSNCTKVFNGFCFGDGMKLNPGTGFYSRMKNECLLLSFR